MQGIDLKLLHYQFSEAAESHFALPPVSDYVLEHIFKPLLADREVCYADLDFSQFSEGDIADLEAMLEARERQKEGLSRINQTFCEALPVSVKHRAFC